MGKQRWEVEVAVDHSCFLNVDSVFDAELISQVAIEKDKVTQVHWNVKIYRYYSAIMLRQEPKKCKNTLSVKLVCLSIFGHYALRALKG